MVDYKDAKEVVKLISSKDSSKIKDYREEYNGVRDKRALQIGKRLPKKVSETEIIQPVKLPIDYQQKLVLSAVRFLVGKTPDLIPSEENEASVYIDNVFKQNRFSVKIKKFAEAVMSETFAAIIFNIDENKEVKFRIKDSSNGLFFPEYDEYGDLISFTWKWNLGDNENVWIFDKTTIYKHEKTKDKELSFVNSEEHGFDVIPVVFTSQAEPEWWKVKDMIDRLEMTLSKLCETNDYFASPIMLLKGNVESMPEKDETGKALLIDMLIKDGKSYTGDASFLTWDHAPAAIELEIRLLKQFIHEVTQTADVSFENVKGIGVVSGTAMKFMFMDPIGKAEWKSADYEMVILRIIAVVKSGMKRVKSSLNTSSEKLTYNIKFNNPLPNDQKEKIEMLVEATGGKAILSQEEGSKQSGIAPKGDFKVLKAEQAMSIGESYNG